MVIKTTLLPPTQLFHRHWGLPGAGKLQGLIPGTVPRVNNAGASQSWGSPETTARHKAQEEAEVLARAEGGRGSWGGQGQHSGTGEGAGGAALGEEGKGVPWPQSP